jgi:hypothetical protein
MRAIDRPKARLLAGKDRHKDGQIGQMVPAMIGIIEQKNVARMDVAGEELGHRFCRVG